MNILIKLNHLNTIKLALLLCLASSFRLEAQEVLYPGVFGEDLLNAVQMDYTPVIQYSYAEARDTLYARIDAVNDSIYGVYTDFGVYLTPNTDPTSTLFSAGINTEHIYPQGKGATDGSPAHRNMHHLAPTKVNVNSDRASLPFADILDQVTDKWYWKDQVLNNIPSSNIDEYSESTGSFFEPKESYKGNIARAVFYIHAIYRDQVEAVDPDFFEIQKEDLCAWHFMDPVDAHELTRTEAIASYQDGKENPFVLDCTLAERMYCQGVGECVVTNITQKATKVDPLKLIHNIRGGNFYLQNVSGTPVSFILNTYTMQGETLSAQKILNLQDEGIIALPRAQAGQVLLLQAVLSDGNIFSVKVLYP